MGTAGAPRGAAPGPAGAPPGGAATWVVVLTGMTVVLVAATEVGAAPGRTVVVGAAGGAAWEAWLATVTGGAVRTVAGDAGALALVVTGAGAVVATVVGDGGAADDAPEHDGGDAGGVPVTARTALGGVAGCTPAPNAHPSTLPSAGQYDSAPLVL